MLDKPYSQACENNKAFIYEVLCDYIKPPASVLEIGSGTGQHAAYLSQKLAGVCWQPSDVAQNLPGIASWVQEAGSDALKHPIVLDVNQVDLDVEPHSYVFTANTLHIMSWSTVVNFFNRLSALLVSKGVLFVYGPFKYNGHYTSDSNRRFDAYLKQHAPHQGIRDVEALLALAELQSLRLLADHEMPANNRLLVFQGVEG